MGALLAAATLLFGAVPAGAQGTPTLRWVRQFGPATGVGVAVAGAGSIYVAGYTSVALAGQPWSGGWDAFLRKFDSAGNTLWTRQFGGPGSEFPVGVASDFGGTTAVAGYVDGALPGLASFGGPDVFVRVYDPSGNPRWTDQFGTAAEDRPFGVATDGAGNVYVAGSTEGALPGQVSLGLSDDFLRKYDANGNVVWSRQFGTGGWDLLRGVVVDGAGNAFVVGEFADPDIGGQQELRKYDPAGNVLWTRPFVRFAGPWGVSADGAGNAYVVGVMSLVLPGQPPTGNDAVVRTYDSVGNEVWTRRFGTAATDVGMAVAVGTTGAVYVSGFTLGAFPGQASSGGDDVFVARIDPTGTVTWIRQFGTRAHELALGVAVSGSGTAYVAGYTDGAFLTQPPSGFRDAYVAKVVHDTDGDCLSDDEEGTYGTDPNSADTDGDGVPDGVEALGRDLATMSPSPERVGCPLGAG